MRLQEILEDRTRTIVAVSIVIIVLPLAYSLGVYVLVPGSPAGQPFLERPDPKHRRCVRETEYMRFHHMDLLKQIREEVIREGKRGELRLSSCRDCHTSRERFCDRCHTAASLNVDCFGCHYYPASGSESKVLTGKVREGWIEESS